MDDILILIGIILVWIISLPSYKAEDWNDKRPSVIERRQRKEVKRFR